MFAHYCRHTPKSHNMVYGFLDQAVDSVHHHHHRLIWILTNLFRIAFQILMSMFSQESYRSSIKWKQTSYPTKSTLPDALIYCYCSWVNDLQDMRFQHSDCVHHERQTNSRVVGRTKQQQHLHSSSWSLGLTLKQAAPMLLASCVSTVCSTSDLALSSLHLR